MSNTADNDQQQDKLLFSEAVSGITPLVQDKIIPLSEKNPSTDIKSIKTVVTDDYTDINDSLTRLSDGYDPFEDDQQRYNLNYHQVSISKRRFNEFKKGNYNTELLLDLHGYNKDQARIELATFIEHSYFRFFQQFRV